VSAKKKWLAWATACLLVATCSALALWLLVRHDQRLAIGEELVYDDFGFRVRSTREVGEVGLPDARVTAGAGNVFEIVRFEMENHARRVEYDMSNHRAVLEDTAGRTYPVDEDATRALAQEMHAVGAPAKVRAGDFTSSDLVFRVPDGASALRLRVKWNSEPMAGLDVAVYGDRTIALGR
jgi:hypothetical protein